MQQMRIDDLLTGLIAECRAPVHAGVMISLMPCAREDRSEYQGGQMCKRDAASDRNSPIMLTGAVSQQHQHRRRIDYYF